MVRIVCALLAVCLVLLSFGSCARVPREAETIYPCVEGRRIPFEVLATGKTKKNTGCVVLQNRRDVQEAIDEGLVREGLSDRLKRVNYLLYTVLCVTRWDSDFIPGTVIELLERDGSLGVVYESLEQEGLDPYWGIMDGVVTPSVYALLLVRKRDLKGIDFGDELKVSYIRYTTFAYNPDKFHAYKIEK